VTFSAGQTGSRVTLRSKIRPQSAESANTMVGIRAHRITRMEFWPRATAPRVSQRWPSSSMCACCVDARIEAMNCGCVMNVRSTDRVGSSVERGSFTQSSGAGPKHKGEQGDSPGRVRRRDARHDGGETATWPHVGRVRWTYAVIVRHTASCVCSFACLDRRPACLLQ
jgi:hypothetical protein